jgi:2',3'-cyclic-nucleotide 2'-phosphodiesterase (5'-nucleotidase family)
MKKLQRFLFCFLLLFCFFVSTVYSQEQEIRILHLNDFHGLAAAYKAFGSDEMVGGISYLAWLADRLRNEKPTLFLAAGDMIQGNNWANLFKGKSVIELMNEMGFDTMVVGNHEFDFGQNVLKERISEAKFPFLGANVEGLDKLNPYIIKELEGVRIAIIGIVTEDTPILTHPDNVRGLKFLSPVETVEKYTKELRDRVDIIIVLSHIGFDADMMLANKVKGIDVIVGGHSHTKTGRHMLIGKTIIVQAWEHGMVLGVLDLKVKDGKIIEADSHLEEIKPKLLKKSDAVSSIVEKYTGEMNTIMGKTVCETENEFDGENVRERETNLGNLIADIMRQTSGAELAIINGGAIRASIGKGQVKVNDIYSALPFDNYIVAMKLTGKQIKDTLEHGVSALEERAGRFPQVSGVAFSYSRSAEKGSRVKDIFIDGKPIEPDRDYVVATSDFLAAGGDGYRAFGEAIRVSNDFSVIGGTIKSNNLVYTDPGKWLRDVVVEYLKAKNKILSIVEGRIKEID